MQALSFAVHIPLVCFGVAFPALVLGMEWLGRRRGDPLLLALARRWSRAMIALFAVGVVTGTILSFELGLLWPEFMATYGDVFGLAFALEGFSFFVEAIFIAIYVYGWDRLSPRAHMLAGIPVVIAGFSGSLMVITVNGWMNHPSGFRLEGGRVVDVRPFDALFGNPHFWHEMVHMYLAAFLVAGLRDGERLRGRGAARAARPLRARGDGGAAGRGGDRRARAGHRRRLGGAHGRREPADEARGVRGSRPHARRARRSTSAAGTTRRPGRCGTASRSRGCCRCSPSTTRTRRCEGLDRGPARGPPARQRRASRVRDDGRHRHADGDLRRGAAGRVVAAPRAARRRAGSCGRSPRSGRCRSSR